MRRSGPSLHVNPCQYPLPTLVHIRCFAVECVKHKIHFLDAEEGCRQCIFAHLGSIGLSCCSAKSTRWSAMFGADADVLADASLSTSAVACTRQAIPSHSTSHRPQANAGKGTAPDPTPLSQQTCSCHGFQTKLQVTAFKASHRCAAYIIMPRPQRRVEHVWHRFVPWS